MSAAMQDQVISRRGIVWMLMIGGVGLIGSLFLLVFGDTIGPPSTAKGSSYSDSAVGHEAFVNLLRAMDYRVFINRDPQAKHITERDLIIIAEPDIRLFNAERLESLSREKARVLIVLPKWAVWPSSEHPGWIDRAELLPLESIQILADMVIEGSTTTRSSVETLSLNRFPEWSPTLGDAQFVTSLDLRPIVSGADGNLMAYVESANLRVAVLSDPDLIANHGLHLGDNAHLALALVDVLLQPGGRIFIDETLHGFAVEPNIWRLMFEPPYLAATLLALVAMLLIVWHSARRFGAPLPPAPAFSSGKDALIENAARLLISGGHGAHVAERYGEATVIEAGQRLRLTSREPTDDLRPQLERIAERRGIKSNLPRRRHPALHPVALAQRYHQWKLEMFGGS
jgi:hypothetical protein